MKMTTTNELPAEIMENGIHYTLVGDYYFPTCMLGDKSPNGKWASLYERYLQENYTDPSLCLSKVGDRFNISAAGIRAEGVRRAGGSACSGDGGGGRRE